MKTDGTQIHKIHLKEEDRKDLERKLAALALVYKKLTNKILTFEFVKTAAEEKKRKRKAGKKGGERRGKEEGKEAPKETKEPKEAPKA